MFHFVDSTPKGFKGAYFWKSWFFCEDLSYTHHLVLPNLSLTPKDYIAIAVSPRIRNQRKIALFSCCFVFKRNVKVIKTYAYKSIHREIQEEEYFIDSPSPKEKL